MAVQSIQTIVPNATDIYLEVVPKYTKRWNDLTAFGLRDMLLHDPFSIDTCTITDLRRHLDVKSERQTATYTSNNDMSYNISAESVTSRWEYAYTYSMRL